MSKEDLPQIMDNAMRGAAYCGQLAEQHSASEHLRTAQEKLTEGAYAIQKALESGQAFLYGVDPDPDSIQ